MYIYLIIYFVKFLEIMGHTVTNLLFIISPFFSPKSKFYEDRKFIFLV